MKLSSGVSDFTLIGMTALRSAWDRSSELLRELHQCSGLCKVAEDTFHSIHCEYVNSLDHQRALDDATAYLVKNSGGRVSGTLSIADVSVGIEEGSGQAELTLSFLTDPISLKATTIFDNGRHRATALFDAGATGLVPIFDTP